MVQYRRICGRRSDKQTRDNSISRASIASRGRNAFTNTLNALSLQLLGASPPGAPAPQLRAQPSLAPAPTSAFATYSKPFPLRISGYAIARAVGVKALSSLLTLTSECKVIKWTFTKSLMIVVSL